VVENVTSPSQLGRTVSDEMTEGLVCRTPC